MIYWVVRKMRQRKKLQGSPSKRGSIDGIMPSSGRPLGAPITKAYYPQKSDSLETNTDYHKRSDGFHPLRSSSASLGAKAEEVESALLDEPIVLDDLPEPKKRKSAGIGKRRKRPRLSKLIKRSLLGLLILLLIGGLLLGYKAYKAQRQILGGGGQAPAVCNGEVPLEQLKTEGDARVNVLLLGMGGETHADGPMATDTIILASIDPITDKVVLLSIPRDLYVRIPEYGSERINAAYLYGRETSQSNERTQLHRSGISLVDKTLKPIFGVPIHYHTLVDFEAFRQTVNAMGGVDISVPEELAVRENLWDEGTGKNYALDVGAGQQHFDGTRALFFARSRYTSPRGDFDRSERQRLMLIAVKDKALSLGTLTNPIRISSLLDSLGNNVYTDFDSTSIKCLSKQIAEINSANITSLDLVTPPNDLLGPGNVPGKSTLVPKAGLYDYSQIQKYIRTALRDGYLARENSSVAIYNATTTAGLATTKADELKTYGYYVTTIESVGQPTNPETTTLIDLSKGADKYTKHYLQNRLGVTAGSSIDEAYGITPPEGTKFVIILGKDANNSQR